MSRSHAHYAAEMYRTKTDARNAALNDELLLQLTDAAFSVLQHDVVCGPPADYQREQLRKKFARVLKIKLRD